MIIRTLPVLGLFLISACAASGHDASPHWTYSGDTGPAHWADLDPAWSVARDGREQSPIDVAGAVGRSLPPIELDYAPSQVDIVNNGHSIQVNYDEGSSLRVDGESYRLVQFHFHAPSEHTVDGRSFPMEMHLVHAAEEGRLAVLGVLIERGAANEAIASVWKHLPAKPGDRASYDDRVDAGELLPATLSAWRYSGSLTTPPCSEGVRWMLLKEPIELSADQIGAFTAICSGNNRPVQPLHGRAIETDR